MDLCDSRDVDGCPDCFLLGFVDAGCFLCFPFFHPRSHFFTLPPPPPALPFSSFLFFFDCGCCCVVSSVGCPFGVEINGVR